MSRPARRLAWIGLAAAVMSAPGWASSNRARVDQPGHSDIALFFQAASRDNRQARAALDQIAAAWRNGYAAMFVDLARLMRPARRAPAGPTIDAPAAPADDEPARSGGGALDTASPAPPNSSSLVRDRLTRFLEKQTGHRFGDDLGRWREWIWSLPYDPHPDYALFKGRVYAQIDARMHQFFPRGVRSLIRLDEVDWGGVRVNGIPPLDHPRHVSARDAAYLKDGNVVFGIYVNGEARAYPKRILAWHELARDRLGGVEMTVVYCTLCGTVIPYESEAGGAVRKFGTSGLLYQSNKLMFDEESMSLWSTLDGMPVVGPLAGSSLQLRAHSAVTTTWREWRSEHPETTVLSLETGFNRDYSEGAAYRDYFATDRLMFRVSRTDNRLKNKAELVVMLLASESSASHARQPVAVSVEFLASHPLYQVQAAGRNLVIVTSPEGANRVYDAEGYRFVRRLPDGRVEDAASSTWRVTEAALVSERDPGRRLPRVPAQRVFWFGWYAQFPDTILIKPR